jgi:cobalt-zinc-cadmium efflux system protein
MSGSAHGHSHTQGHHHHHADTPARFGAAFALGAALNAALVAAQLVFGVLAHSSALLADAVHNFGDVLALLLAWAAAWAGGRHPSARRTYGWGRASILAALVNAVVLLIGVGAIGVEAVQRLAHPATVAGPTVMAVAATGILVNGFAAWLFAHGRHDLNLRAAFQHMAADAMVSLGVALAAGLILLTGENWIDPLASLAIVAVIVAGTWSTLVQACDLALDAVPAAVSYPDVAAYLESLAHVREVHDLHIWGLSTSQTALTAHLVGDADPATVAWICHELQARFGIDHATLQVETEATAASCRLRPSAVI